MDIVNNSDFIDTNVSTPTNNLNKNLDNAQRGCKIKKVAEKSKSYLSGLIRLKKENTNNRNIAFPNINNLKEKAICLARNIS